MQLVADILLGAGAIGAALYCLVLSRRLRAFNQLEDGMGGAIAVLSVQVDDMTRALAKAEKAATDSSSSLDEMTGRAEAAARKLELMLAAMHDLPDPDLAGRQPMRVLRRRSRPAHLEAAE